MENNLQSGEQPQPDLFDSHVQYVQASQGSRFLNFLIDMILMRLTFNFIVVKLLVNILASLAPEFLMELAFEGDYGWRNILVSLLTWYLSFVFYYTICEMAFKGYTLGKIITGTRAIRSDGNNLTFKDALYRSLCRIVPFEVFSGLGYAPWHDTWTNTTVIKAR